LLNKACIETDTQEVDPNNNCDDSVTFVGTIANVNLEKTDEPAIVALGGQVVYTLSYGNNGNDPANNVVIRDTLPANVAFVSATPLSGPALVCTATAGVVTCDDDGDPGTPSAVSLAAGAAGNVALTVQVYGGSDPNTILALLAGGLSDLACVSTTTSQLTEGDDCDDELTGVYLPPASLAGHVWWDVDQDGIREPGEAGIGDVLITLSGADIFGNAVSLTTRTTGDGAWRFAGLNPGMYSVTETQPSYWLDWQESLGTVDGAPSGTAGNDVFDSITLAAGSRGVDYDFGETVANPPPVGASVSGFVWLDDNQNVAREPGEPGIAGVTVTLTGADVDSNPVTRTTLTLADGSYAFYGLRPGAYQVTETQPAGYYSTGAVVGTVNGVARGTANSMDELIDIVLASGDAGVRYDFGEATTPLAVTLSNFSAEVQGDHILIAWETTSEIDSTGFNLYRSLSPTDQPALLGFTPSAAPGSSSGAAYRFEDFDVQPGLTYWYWVEAIDVNGVATRFDPVSATYQSPTAVALGRLTADAAAANSTALPGVTVAVLLALAAAALLRGRRNAAA
jgi:uncharacterized repeat protein (TIGR01451 family)